MQHVQIYSCDPGLRARVTRDVRAICARRKLVKGRYRGHVPLNGAVTDLLVVKLVEAATHAASRPIPNKVASRGAPPDNARVLLASDICCACRELELSAGLRYAQPQSLAVELYVAIARHIWPSHTRQQFNPRNTFRRMKAAAIVRN